MRKKIKPRYISLSAKKLSRALIKSPLQFIAIILITVLASTLFTGFYSSAEQFKNQVATADRLSNTANIVTTVSVDSESDVKKEYEGIKSVLGDKGKLETRYCFETKLNGYDNYVCLYDEYPTISKEFYFGDKNAVDKENFFVIDYRYPTSSNTFGTSWKDKDGNLLPITVSFPMGQVFGDSLKGSDFIHFLKDESKGNPFTANFLNLKMTPNTYMKTYDNISDGQTFTPYTFLSRNLFNQTLSNFFKENFDPDKAGGSEEARKIIKDPVGTISDKYYKNNQYLTKLTDESDTTAVSKSLSNYFDKKGKENNLLANIEKKYSEATKVVTTDVNQTIALSYVSPSIFLFVSLLVILTTFTQIVLKERNEIGTLKAMGVSPRKIIGYYICLGLVVISVGCILGVILGPTLIPSIFDIKFRSLYILPSRVFVYPTLAAILSSFGILLLTSLVIYIVCKRECKLPPSFSLRPVLPKGVKSSSKNKEHKISALSYLMSSLDNANKKEIIIAITNYEVKTSNNFVIQTKKDKINPLTEKIIYKGKEITYKKKNNAIPLKLALRNIKCSIPKSIMVVVGIAGCVAILGGSFGIDDSLNNGLNNEMRRFLSSDINITFNNITDETQDKIESYIDSGEIEDYELYSAVPGTIYKPFSTELTYTSTIYTINPDSSFLDLDGMKPSGRKVIVTKKVADKLDLKVGTLIKFNALGYTINAEVMGILNSFYIQGIFASGLSPTFTKLYTAKTGLYIKTNKAKVKSNYEFAQELLKIPGVVNYFEYERNYAVMADTFKGLSYITLILKIAAIALAIIVLYNFILLNYKQRSRDIATMKVLGFNNRQLGMSIMYEVLILVVAGTIIGFALSLPFTSLLLSINKNELITFSSTIFPITYVYSALITLGTTILVNIFVIMRNKKIKMIESLKSVE